MLPILRRAVDDTSKHCALFWALAAILASSAAYLTMRATSLYGVGLSADSVAYIRLARDISENGFSFLSENKAISQPPLFPALLAFLSHMTGAAPLHVARYLNVAISLALVATIMLSVVRVTAFLPSIIAIGILAVSSVPLIHVLSMAWTEPLFILLVSVSFLLITSSKHTLLVVFIAGLLTTAACLTRYAGIVVVPLVAAYVCFVRSGSPGGRLARATAYAVAPCALFGLYVLRNWALSGHLLGSRAPSNMGFKSNAYLATHTVCGWFLPRRICLSTLLMLGLLILLGIVLSFHRDRLASVIRDSECLVLLYGAFALVYTTFIVYTSSTTAYDRVDDRLLAPAYPALLVVFAFSLKPELWGTRTKSVAVVCGFCLLFVATPLRAVISDVNTKAIDGAGGFASRRWQESALIANFRENEQRKAETLFSNVPDALYILAGVEARRSPAVREFNSEEATGVTASNVFDRYPGLDGALLVWFDRVHHDFLFTPKELDVMSSLRPIETFSDGTIYRIGLAR